MQENERIPPLARLGALRWLVAAGLALALVALLEAVFAQHQPGPAASPPPASGNGFRPTSEQWSDLKFSAVRQMEFRPTVQAEGRIALDEDATTPVFSPVSGRVTRLFAKPGDAVKAGSPLLAVAATELVQGANDLEAAVGARETAAAQLKVAQVNENRQRELYQSNGAALRDWQQAQADRVAAESAYRSAESALRAARDRLRILGITNGAIDALERSRSASQAEAIVRAPIGGTVLQRQVGLGQYIVSASAGASAPVYSIGDLSRVWLVANVSEAAAARVRTGDLVEVRVLALPGRVFRARVTYVAASLDPETHRLAVRAEIANPHGELKPQMFARFSIVTGAPVAGPAVPEEAVIYEGDTARVWVAGPDRTLALRQIRAGRVQEGMVEVLDGLQAGETVVTSGSLFIDRAAKGD